MAYVDETTANAILDLIYSGALADEWELVLFASNPELEVDPLTVEIPEAGRATILAADWAAADAYTKSTDALVQMPDTLAAYSDPAAYFGLLGDDGGWYFTGPFLDPVEVTEAGDGPQIAVTVYMEQAIEEPD